MLRKQSRIRRANSWPSSFRPVKRQPSDPIPSEVSSNETVEVSGDSSTGRACRDINREDAFLDVCVEGIKRKLRSGGSWSRDGLMFIQTELRKRGFSYKKEQLKTHWRYSKAEFSLWKQLLKKQTGCGWDDKTQTIVATSSWWDRAIAANKNVRNLRKNGLRRSAWEKMCIIFESCETSEDTSVDVIEISDDDEDAMTTQETVSRSSSGSEESSGSSKMSDARKFKIVGKRKRKLLAMATTEQLVKQTRYNRVISIGDAVRQIGGLPGITTDLWVFAAILLRDIDRRERFYSIPREFQLDYLQYLKRESEKKNVPKI